MSVADVIQAFGWIPVVWLLAIHLLIRFGRLPRHGAAVRIAGFAAALTIVAAALATRMWPIAALGFLFLRTEFFGHHDDEARESHWVHRILERVHLTHDDGGLGGITVPDDASSLSPHPEGHSGRIHHGASGVSPQLPHPANALPGMSAASATTLRARTHDKTDPDFVPAPIGLRETHHPHHEAGSHPTAVKVISKAKRFTDLILKIEIAAMVVIALTLFGLWAEGQREGFNRDSDSSVCKLSYNC